MEESYLSPALWQLLDKHKREMTRYLIANWQISWEEAIHLMDGLLEEVLTWSTLNFLVTSSWVQPALMRRGVESGVLRESSAMTKELWIVAISKLPAVSAQIYKQSMLHIYQSSVYARHVPESAIAPRVARDCDTVLPASCAVLTGEPIRYHINQGRYVDPTIPHFLDRVSHAALTQSAAQHGCSFLAAFIREVVHQYLGDITSENTLRWMKSLAGSGPDVTALPLLAHPVFASFKEALAVEPVFISRSRITGTV